VDLPPKIEPELGHFKPLEQCTRTEVLAAALLYMNRSRSALFESTQSVGEQACPRLAGR
jgi:hypothetical protein